MKHYKRITNLKPEESEDFADLADFQQTAFTLGFIVARASAAEEAIKIEGVAQTFEELLRKAWAMQGVSAEQIDKMIDGVYDRMDNLEKSE